MKKTKHLTDDPKWYEKVNTHTGFRYSKDNEYNIYKPKNKVYKTK